MIDGGYDGEAGGESAPDRPDLQDRPVLPERGVTQQDVARRAGVSRAVVSYVVNNGPRVVSSEARERVLRAIAELGYRPNKYAQGLRLQAADRADGQIGILLGGHSAILYRPYFSAVLAGIFDAARHQHQQIRFMSFFHELLDPVFFNKNIHPEEISGLILFAPYLFLQEASRQPASPASHLLARIIERVDNIVSLEVVSRDLPAVIFDRAAAARLAVEHLVRLGHRRIAFAGVPDERVDGYRQVLFQSGLPGEEALIQAPGTHNSPEEGYQAVQALLALPRPPTALFTASDEVAIGALAALHDLGRRVPDDVALASIDDIEFAGIIRPALTTVHVPKEQFGVYALQMLAMRQAYPDSKPASVVLPTELVVRQSCGAGR